MHMSQRIRTVTRGLLKRYGPSRLKRALWDQEFSGSHWDFIDDTSGDCVYAHLEKHLNNGDMLDLGCGPGNTANELAVSAYSSYLGVDISEAALAKARKRTEANGRSAKNSFACSDFLCYQPTNRFDVILFRESMYHVPLGKVKPILDHFSQYLKENGAFVVRMNISDGKGGNKQRLASMVKVIDSDFDVLEKSRYGELGPTVIVFRPKMTVAHVSKQPDNKYPG